GSPWFMDQPFDGPLRIGERVDVTLKMNPHLRMLTGRLLGADRAPFAGAASIRIAGPGAGMWNLERDPDGRFFVPLAPHLGDRPSSVAATFLPDPALQRMSVRLLLPRTSQERPEQALRRGAVDELVEDGDRLRADWPNLGAGPHRLVVECPGQQPVLDLVIDV